MSMVIGLTYHSTMVFAYRRDEVIVASGQLSYNPKQCVPDYSDSDLLFKASARVP